LRNKSQNNWEIIKFNHFHKS